MNDTGTVFLDMNAVTFNDYLPIDLTHRHRVISQKNLIFATTLQQSEFWQLHRLQEIKIILVFGQLPVLIFARNNIQISHFAQKF